MPIRPGRFSANQTDYSAFVNSMADEMDKALNELMLLDNLPPLKMDPNDREVRDRRRLFVAIARGIAIHLRDNDNAFEVTLPILGNPVVTPDIKVDLT